MNESEEICGLSVTGTHSKLRLHGNITKDPKTGSYVATVKMFRNASGLTVDAAVENLHAQMAELYPEGFHLQLQYFEVSET